MSRSLIHRSTKDDLLKILQDGNWHSLIELGNTLDKNLDIICLIGQYLGAKVRENDNHYEMRLEEKENE